MTRLLIPVTVNLTTTNNLEIKGNFGSLGSVVGTNENDGDINKMNYPHFQVSKNSNNVAYLARWLP
jgi:hypothetical protein